MKIFLKILMDSPINRHPLTMFLFCCITGVGCSGIIIFLVFQCIKLIFGF